MPNVVRFENALKYEAPQHDVTVHSMYLQHRSTGSEGASWVSVSYSLPGARAEMSASPLKRTYVVLDGELTVEFGDETVRLGPLDSIYIGPNERREARNETNRVVTILVTMPYPKEAGTCLRRRLPPPLNFSTFAARSPSSPGRRGASARRRHGAWPLRAPASCSPGAARPNSALSARTPEISR